MEYFKKFTLMKDQPTIATDKTMIICPGCECEVRYCGCPVDPFDDDDEDDDWCHCEEPELTYNRLREEKGQAFCLKCFKNWYH